MGRGDLSDAQWEELEPLLPPQKPRTGRENLPHRPIVDGILWHLRTGAPWRDIPERYGNWKTIYSRFQRWSQKGIWQEVYAKLQQRDDFHGEIDWSIHFVDSSIIRAHQHAAGAPKKGAKSPTITRSDEVVVVFRPKST